MKVSLLAIICLPIIVVLASGCTQTVTTNTTTAFKLPDHFIDLMGFKVGEGGGWVPMTTEACDAHGWLQNAQNYIVTPENCEMFNDTAPCLEINLEINDWLYHNETTGVVSGYFPEKLNCGGESGKAHCQLKLDNNAIVRQGCISYDPADSVTFYYKATDLRINHTLTVCCSATDSESGFDLCKSFTLEKRC